MKKLKTKLIKAISTGLLIISFAPTAMAAIPNFTCNDLNGQQEPSENGDSAPAGNAEKLQNYIVTILEEEISGSGGNDFDEDQEVKVLTCIRKTSCTEANERTECTSEYVPLGTQNCSPGENEFCQRVQVIIAQSGINLLMTYLGIIYRWAAGIIGIISVAYLIYGGFLVATAQDDTGKIDTAKEKIFQSLAGLVLLFLSAVILYTINPNFFTLT